MSVFEIAADQWRVVNFDGNMRFALFIDKAMFEDTEKDLPIQYSIKEHLDKSIIMFILCKKNGEYFYETLIINHPYIKADHLFEGPYNYELICNGDVLKISVGFKKPQDYIRLKNILTNSALANDIEAVKWCVEVGIKKYTRFDEPQFPNWSLYIIGDALRAIIKSDTCKEVMDYLIKNNDFDFSSYCFLVNKGMFRVFPKDVYSNIIRREYGMPISKFARQINSLGRDWIRVRYCFYYKVPYSPTVHTIYLHREMTKRFISDICKDLPLASKIILANPDNTDFKQLEELCKDLKFKSIIGSEYLEIDI